jgi:RNA polymerase sigma-70 factor (ECF subfamily)
MWRPASIMRPEPESDLARLNRRFRPALMAFFLRRLRNHAEAEDMTQDVFVRLAGADAGQMKSADAYIFQIAANLLRDRGRREKVRADYRERLWSQDGAEVDPLDPLRFTADRESLQLLVGGLRELPEPTRAIFVLYRLENVDKRAIAETYGLAMSSVDRHLAKAMAHLIARVRSEP